VRPPAVIPGLAEVTVRVQEGAPEHVLVQPVQFEAGVKGAPPADEARPVRGEKGLWSGQLWIMTAGSYSVRVRLTGAAGEGLAVVPVAAVRTRTLGMQKALGLTLAGLGLFLFAGALTLVGAAVRESVPAAGAADRGGRRRAARFDRRRRQALVEWRGRRGAEAALPAARDRRVGAAGWHSPSRDHRSALAGA